MKHYLISSLALGVVVLPALRGQTLSDPNPRLGLQPTATYSLSQIETINQTNGNLGLSIPLGSLGPDRVGANHGISLIYNSKIWEPLAQSTVSAYQTVFVQGIGPSNTDNSGWQFQAGYELETTARDGLNTSPCPVPVPIQWTYYYKTRIIFPDGSKHLLRLGTFPDYGGDGYYQYSPEGFHSEICGASGTQLTGPLVYYTDDGTFVRLVVYNNGSAGSISWTLNFRNGDYVCGGNGDVPCIPNSAPVNYTGRAQQVCDANGNCSSIQNAFNPYLATPYTATMSDEYNRPINVSFGVLSSGGADTITVPGFNGQTLTWSVKWTSVGTAAPNNASYVCQDVSDTGTATCGEPYAGYMVSEIDPPDPLGEGIGHYEFTYNAKWGELSGITLPSGAVANYTYWLDGTSSSACPTAPSAPSLPYWYDVLADYPCQKKVYWGGNTSHSADETSSLAINQSTTNNTVSYTSSVFTGPDGGQTTTKFYPFSYNSGADPGNWQAGLVYEVDQPDGTIISKTWAENWLPGTQAQRQDCSICTVWWPYDSMNPYVQSETRTLGGSTATTTYTVDRNGNPLVTTEGDWITGNPLLRQTTLTYYNATSSASTYSTTNESNIYWNSGAASLLSLPSTKEVDGQVSPSTYDQYCYDNGVATPVNGNLTLHARLQSGSPGSIVTCSSGSVTSNATSTQAVYGSKGALLASMDARRVVTRLQHDSNLLYVTEKDDACYFLASNQTLASLSLSGACTLAEARRTQYTNDLNTGKVTVARDLDNSTSSSTVQTSTNYDIFARPTSITDSAGGVTNLTYQDAPVTVNGTTYGAYQITASPLDSGRQVVSAKCFDLMGRLVLTQLSENGTSMTVCNASQGIQAQAQYGYTSAGRYEWTSNPSRASGGESTAGWTRKYYDTSGRLAEVATFSGYTSPGTATAQSLSNLTGQTTHSYSGACTTIKDQRENAAANTGNVKTTCVDAAGRTQQVTEAPDSTGTAHTTTYTYDGMSNLVSVAQGQQTRTFVYDALGRLTSATNPETGNAAVTYAYDNNGNLIKKTDPRSISTCFGPVSGTTCNASATYDGSPSLGNDGYDGLNRVLMKNYTDSTPPVAYTYDQDLSGGLTNYPHGRLVSVASGGTTVQYNRFDAMGRVLKHTQTTASSASSPFVFSYAYNAGGMVTQETYPSQRVVNTTYDAAGRVATVAGTSTTYIQGPTPSDPTLAAIQYTPSGALWQAKLGNNLYEQWVYNSRQQPTGAAVGSALATPSTASVRGLAFDYGGTGNNGNLQSQTISGAGLPSNASQTYGYDRLDRLSSVSEASAWSRSFGYDQYGNGWVQQSPAPTGIMPGGFTPQASTDYDTATNRDNTPHDAAGNQTQSGGYGYTYDAENRLILSDLTSLTAYQYDGNGRRVAKVDCPSSTSPCNSSVTGATTTWYAYDADGQLAAEYTNGSSTAPCTTCYLTADHLGSTRVMTDASGNPVQCHDYLPFGEEIMAGIGGRTGCYGSSPGTGVLFTGQMRDETWESGAPTAGLDYFGARYFSSAQGRFTSPDVPLLDQDPSDPQSWNLYSYVRNNPLIFTDLTGDDCVYVNSSNDGISSIDNQTTSKQCGKGGGYWVDGTVTDARFAYGGLILTGTTNGDDRTSASYALGPDPGLMALQQAGQMASPVTDPRFIAGFYGASALGGLGFAALSGGGGLTTLGTIEATGASSQIATGSTAVYQSVNAAGEIQYVGITNNLARRAAQHAARFVIQRIPGLSNLARADARAVEQVLIENFQLGKNGGTLLNQINSIAQSNPAYAQAIQRGIQILKSVGYPGF
jgi:RHS repeat-associated protein